MSDLLIVESPVLSPGKCFRCSDYKGPCIDTGVDGWDGRIYICFRCVDSIIERRGGANPEQVARFEALLNDAEDEIQQLKDGRQELRRELVSEIAGHILNEGIEAADRVEAAAAQGEESR